MIDYLLFDIVIVPMSNWLSMTPPLSNLPRDGKGRLLGSFREVFDVLDNLWVDEDTPFTSLLHSHLEIEDIRILLDQCYQCQCCPRHQQNRGRESAHQSPHFHDGTNECNQCQCVCRHFSRWLERVVVWE